MEITKAKEVLVVDDEPGILKVVTRILEDQYRVTTALGGQAALDILKDRGGLFDVILCDINMPKPAGKDLYDDVASKYPDLLHRFIFMTGGINSSELNQFINNISNLHRMYKAW